MTKTHDVYKVWEHIGRIKTNDIKACVKNSVIQSGIDRANLITSGRSHFVYTLTHFWG